MSKSKFSADYVRKLAELIKLELSDKEATKFATEMDETLDYIENLESLETTAIEPTFQTTGIVNRFQNEKTGERSLNEKEVFQNAASRHQDYFQIKGLNYGK